VALLMHELVKMRLVRVLLVRLLPLGASAPGRIIVRLAQQWRRLRLVAAIELKLLLLVGGRKRLPL
jgi:hypothetical protein